MMTDFAICTWDDLREKIGLEGANVELDRRISGIFNTLRDITSVSSKNILTRKVRELKYSWFPAIDQYERTILNLAALNGNTRLVCALVDSGARINAKDGIGQSPLTLALHMGYPNRI
jgi:ankyrin repeat protein